MNITPVVLLNAFMEFKELHQRKRISAQMAFVSGAHYAEKVITQGTDVSGKSNIGDTQRLDWVAQKRTAQYDSDNGEHWIVSWVCQGEAGNKNGASGKFLGRGKSYRECIDKFIEGDIVRID